jgi:two-component system cell cycle response regulator
MRAWGASKMPSAPAREPTRLGMAQQVSLVAPAEPGRSHPLPDACLAAAPLHVLAVSTRADTAARLRELAAGASSAARFEHVARVPDALRRLQQADVDLVLLGMDAAEGGLRVCARLCEAAPHLPIVVLGGSGEESLAPEAARIGAQDFVVRDGLTPERLARAMACAVERNRQLVALRDLSLTDPLTGLYNRRGFALLADAHLRMLRRTRRQSVLLFADVDDLKHVNDTHGHAAGDRAIVATARALTGVLRGSDIVARYGGDEFVALAHDATHGATHTLVARVMEGVAALNREGGLPFTLSLSIGAVSFGGSEGRIADVLARADRALYRHKRNGRAVRPPRRAVPAGV